MPRHIDCLTFGFGTQSAVIARGKTSPTFLPRGKLGAMASGRILDFQVLIAAQLAKWQNVAKSASIRID